MSAVVRRDALVSVKEIIDAGRVEAHFQPIVSVKRRRVVAIEALARGRASNGAIVSPGVLFGWAEQNGRMVDLDRLCRRKALQAFAAVLDTHPDLHLFMNFESAILDEGVGGSGALARAVLDAGVPPGQVVLEINESRVRDAANLIRFVDRHRSQGFLIAIDDLGVGDSNLPRIPALKPDVLKLDRQLVAGMKGNYYREETFRAIVRLGRKLGALIIAEGVETETEATSSLDLGADLLQGYLLARPAADAGAGIVAAQGMTEQLAQQWRAVTVEGMRRRQLQSQRFREVLFRVRTRLIAARTSQDFEDILVSAIDGQEDVECLFVLDAEGTQTTETVLNRNLSSGPGRGNLFAPAPQGTDHAAKDYFYGLMDAGLTSFATEPYLSTATGSICRTWSCTVDTGTTCWVLCMDVRV